MRRIAFVVVALIAAACTGRSPSGEVPLADLPELPAPDIACPGGPSCSETLDDSVLLAGAAVRSVTPTRFEIANPAYLNNDRPSFCAPEAPIAVCGELHEDHTLDCGKDGVCPSHEAYVEADVDGTERDGDDDDWFFDCGMDRICPDNVPEEGELALNGRDDDGDGAVDDGAYPGADEGEGDGEFQGLWIAGYGNNRPALGVRDDIEVRAIVLRQGDSTIALVTLDAVGLFFDEQTKMKQKLDAIAPGEVDALFVQSSHTHEAPDTMGQWGYIDPFAGLQDGHGRSDEHMENIRVQGADAVKAALDALVAVDVRVGAVQVPVQNMVHDGRDPQVYNDVLTSIALDDSATGASVATLVAWGNHPESLDSRNNFISSDYVSRVRTAVEQGLPETDTHPARAGRGGVALYLQGAVGGIMGPNGFPIIGRDGFVHENDLKTWARTDAYGENIAENAFAALEEAETLTSTSLRFSAKSYTAIVENQAFHVGLFKGWFDRELLDFDITKGIGEDGNWPTLRTAVGVIYLGDIGFVTAPGELFPETFRGFDGAAIDPKNPNPPDVDAAIAEGAPTLSELLDARYAIPLGLCQDEMGYLVPPYDFKLAENGPYIDQAEGDHYEETNSIGPVAVPLMLENLDVLFDFERARAP
jgi:hypothetical protein